MLIRRQDKKPLYDCMAACISNPDTVHRWMVCKLCKNGQLVWTRQSARAITDAQGRTTILIVCEDISETDYLTQQLSHQVSHDELTGLINRREFERRLQRVLKTVHEERGDYAVCYLDLDQFKIINDTYGHVAGDELLRKLGDLLQKKVRKRDTLARLDGDEFGVLMEHCPLAQARRVANELRESIRQF